MIDLNAPFPNLEPNHTWDLREQDDGVEVFVIVCPFTYPGTDEHFESPWDYEEGENWMVNCLLCEGVTIGHPGDSGCDT